MRDVTAPPDYRLIGEYPGVVRVVGWENVAVCTWQDQATGPAAQAVVDSMNRVGTRQRRGSYVHVIRNKVALPDANARSTFVQVMKERHAELACVAIVVGGAGFWASAMRNAVIGMRVFAPSSFKFRLHGETDEVLEWLPEAHQQLTGVTVPRERLRQMLDRAQAAQERRTV